MFSTQAVSPPRPQKARQQPRSRRARRGAAVLTALGLSLSPLLAGSLPAGAVPAAAVPATNAQAEAEILEIQRFAGEADAKLGSGVAIAGDYVAYTEVLGKSVTFAHLADPVTNTWERTTIAEDELTTGYYGEAIALTPDASRAYVSAPGNPEIFVYARSGSNDWTRDGVLTAPDAEVLVADYGYSMGSSLALEGNRLVVGVPKAEVDEVGWAGLALVVDVTTDEWTTLLPPEPLPFDMAGEKVAISGNLVAAGAPGALHTDEDLTGGVYVWDLSDPSLTPTVLRPTPPESQTCSARLEFGSSVAFNDGTLYVGAPLAGERLTPAGCEAEYDEPGTVDQGAIYRYDRALQQVGGPLLPAPGFGALGGSLAVAGDMLLASSTLPSTGLGQVQVLDRRDFTDEPGSAEPQVATPVQLLTPSSPTAGADFGNQHRGNGIATDGGRAFVGAPREGEGAEQTSDGAAYVFEPALPPRPAVSLTLEASEATIEYGDRTSLTATLSGPQELPEGTVTGSVAGFALDPAALTEGTAALRTPEERISVGSHTVELAFTPAGADVPAAHTQATLTVTPVDTTTLLKVTYEITAVPGAPAAGDTPSSAADPAPGTEMKPQSWTSYWLGGTVRTARGTDPTGTVELWDGNTLIDEFPVAADGSYGMSDGDSPLLVETDTTFEARYLGDSNHRASADALTITGSGGGGTPPPPPTKPEKKPELGAAPSGLARTGADASLGSLALAALLMTAAGGAAYAGHKRRGVKRGN